MTDEDHERTRSSPNEFAQEFKEFLDWMREVRPGEREDEAPPVAKRVQAFFGPVTPASSVLQKELPVRDVPNAHLAVQALLKQDGWSAETVGYSQENEFGSGGLISLLNRSRYDPVREGPAQSRTIAIRGDSIECFTRAILLVQQPGGRAVMHLSLRDRYGENNLLVEILAEPGLAAATLSSFLEQVAALNVYRGAAVSLEDGDGNTLRFHALPVVPREALILPEALLGTIERSTIRPADQATRLHAAGRHLKRGVLLHGPPGTGKSLTVQYIVGALPGRTTIILTGRDLGSVRGSCKLARLLAPSTVILEDVDLIAEAREQNDLRPLLFELLNEMEGIEADIDVLFLLTTNRPEILEPALSARPGRVDQAILFPLPDEDCRRRLVELYGRGLLLEGDAVEAAVQKTAGTSPAFIRELLRKAASFAIERGEAAIADRHEIPIRKDDIDSALREILFAGGELTARLLGGAPSAIGFRTESSAALD